MSDLYNIEVTTIDGTTTTLADWAGHVLLIVNTASQCGLTNQYESLQHIYNEYAARGFFVLGFPCNQFGNQEPGTNNDIAEFCTTEYNVTFPLFSKINVNGPDAHPLYKHLTQHPDTNGEAGDIAWNFEKFLINDTGDIIGRFRPQTDPEDDTILNLIEDNLPI